MTSFDNALKSDEGNSVYPPDLAKAIFELDIPDRIYLKTAMEFDDKYIVNKGNKWTFASFCRFLNKKYGLRCHYGILI